MITALFSLTGMLLFMLSVATMDAWRAVAREIRETDDAIGHDTKIYPDHDYDL